MISSCAPLELCVKFLCLVQMPCPGCRVWCCTLLRCWLRVPPSAVVTQQVLPLSVGWGVLPVLRAGLPATSRSPAQHKRLTGFITMGVGWQSSETMRYRRGTSGADRTWESMSCDLAGAAVWRWARVQGRQELGNSMVPMLGSTSRMAGATPRSTGLNKGLLTDASRTGWVPRRKGELGKIDVCWIHSLTRGVGRWTLSGLVCWGRCERQPWCCLHPQSPSSCNQWDCAGNSSCEGSCESLSWHMPSKALIIDVYCIAHMCCTWQPARELKAARVLYLSCYLKNQIICISFWHCFFSLGSACQGSQCVQRSVCYV